MKSASAFKWIAAILALLLLLTACNKKPQELPAPVEPSQSQEPADPTPEPEPAPEPEQNENSDLTPPAEALEPQPIAPDEHEGETQLVADAFTYTYMYMDDEKQTHEHHYAIPMILLDGAEISALNDEIYRELYNDELIETVENDNDNCGTLIPYYTGVSYHWACNGDILSLVIEAPMSNEGLEYYVYNVSVSNKAEISKDDLLAAYGMSKETYLEQAKIAFVNAFWVWREDLGEIPADYAADFENCLQRTMLVDNLDYATPYLNIDGKLCAYGGFYIPIGGGVHSVAVALEDIELSPDYAEHVIVS